MAQAKTRTAPKKAAAPVECALCGQEIVEAEDGAPVEFQGKMYHGDDCLKTAQRNASKAAPARSKKAAAPVVDDDEEDEEEDVEAEADDEDAEEEDDEED